MAEYIGRQALLVFANNHKGSTIDANDIARFPAADVVEVRHGEWVETKPQPRSEKSCLKNYIFYKCSLCGRFEMHKEPYCHCGADMRGEKNGKE